MWRIRLAGPRVALLFLSGLVMSCQVAVPVPPAPSVAQPPLEVAQPGGLAEPTSPPASTPTYATPDGAPAGCAPGEAAAFVYGVAALKEQLGARMGEPVTCERISVDSGDSLQQTTTGLARYSKTRNVPSFSSGTEHWALTTRGLVYWEGRATEPPDDAQVLPDADAMPETPAPAPARVPTATPRPVPAAPSLALPASLRWLQRPYELLYDYDRRHGTLLSKAIEQSNVVVADAPGFWAAFVPSRRTIVLTPALKSETPEATATVLAHEALHALDSAKYGAPRTEVACYTYETSAFRLQAAVWQSFYGDPGKPDPATELEEELNQVLVMARSDAWRLVADIKDRYQDECS